MARGKSARDAPAVEKNSADVEDSREEAGVREKKEPKRKSAKKESPESKEGESQRESSVKDEPNEAEGASVAGQELALIEEADTQVLAADDALGGLVQLAASAGNLPTRLSGCAFDVASRNWIPSSLLSQVPKARRVCLLTGFTHQVEKARSGAAGCKRCGEKIAKATIRVGYPTKDQRGEYGAIPIWFHVECARKDEFLVATAKLGEKKLRDRLLGFDALSKEERDKLRNDLFRTLDEEEVQQEAARHRAPAVAEKAILPPHPAPESLRVKLLAFQAEGLGWMLAREADPATKGGLLADEMGMGKTLQTIALILAGKVCATLVVCPAAAMLQWRNEILRFTEPGSIDVRLYYGSERVGCLDDLMDGSTMLKRVVILTTYQTLEYEYRKELNKTKVQCEWCGRLFVPGKLVYHQKYFCGPEAERTDKQQKSTRKEEWKTEAVKTMKIGGMETDISLQRDPLSAMRGAATKALRSLAAPSGKNSAGQEAGSSPASGSGQGGKGRGGKGRAMPIPMMKMLPDETRAALGYGGSVAAEQSDQLEDCGPSGSGAVATPPGKRRRVSGKASAADNPEKASAADNLPPGLGKALVLFAEAQLAEFASMTSAASSTPAPVPGPRKRWAFLGKEGQAAGQTGAEKAEQAALAQLQTPPQLPPSFGIGAGWGSALRLRQEEATAQKVIELGNSDEESDLELLSEVGVSEPGSFGFASAPSAAPAASSSSSEKKKRKSKGMKQGQEEGSPALPQGEAGLALPRPDSDDDDELGMGDGPDLSRSPLFRTRWGRVVLDEAHRIKGRTNSTAQAAFAIRVSGSRWCLSGTPLQNRVGDFWSIIRFVQFYPYAHYFCTKKGCDCCSLHYRFDAHNSYCDSCGHSKMQHRSHFAGTVVNPIKKFGFLGAGRAAMEKLRSEVLDRILLRRTKVERAADVQLPSLEIRIRKDQLSSEERDFYKAMCSKSQTQFDTYVEAGTILHNYAHVFDLIMRLRQAVDHPYLIIHGSLTSDPTAGQMPSKSRGICDVCVLCQDDVDDRAQRAKATCGHVFHRDCLTEYLEQAPQLPSGGVGCPSCFMPVTWADEEEVEEEDDGDVVDDAGDEVQEPTENLLGPVAKEKHQDKRGKAFSDSIMKGIKTSEFKTSTKIEALVQEIQQMQARDPTSKALVFSQFVRFLDLIEWRLKREGVSAAKVLGTMPLVSRNNIIVSFQTEPTLKVLLISLKAGGEGLNLQAADHIFIMDPWWNPAAELQAIQRAHRIGQKKPVKATRFVAADTIEEKIVELQAKKQNVFDVTVGNSNEALTRLTSEDIQFLFAS